MTKEGYERLKADLDRMSNNEMLEVARRIASARELGDLSENAEYHAAREDQGILQARIDALRDKLSRAIFIEKSTMPSDTVVLPILKRPDNGHHRNAPPDGHPRC